MTEKRYSADELESEALARGAASEKAREQAKWAKKKARSLMAERKKVA